MKTLDRFGAFVLANWWLWLTVFALAFYGIKSIGAPITVTLDAKHWECTMAVPDGIATRCTEYHYRGR